MTRKRFIKLLMADGYSRNEANTAAAYARDSGIKYSTAYTAASAALPVRIKFDDATIKAVCDAIRNIAETAKKVASAMAKAVSAFAETYRAEMEAN